jgi:hypothetical protein
MEFAAVHESLSGAFFRTSRGECCAKQIDSKDILILPAVSNRFHPKTTAVNQAQ